MKNLLTLLFISAGTLIFAQTNKTCETPSEVVEDLNSITKCTIKKSENPEAKTRQISVRISAPKRYLKKKKKETLGGLNTSGVSNTDHSVFDKPTILKTNLAALTNSLSKEELRTALKFNDVDVVPLFSDCDSSGNKNTQLECFNEEMINHIQKHFVYPKEAMVNKVEGEVWVRFIIDTNGNVTNIKTLGPEDGELLEDEAVRVVSNLPKLTPGSKNGKRIPVKYGFPINFSLEDIH